MEPVAAGQLRGARRSSSKSTRGPPLTMVVRGSTRGGPHAATPSAAASARVRASRDIGMPPVMVSGADIWPRAITSFTLHRVRTTTAVGEASMRGIVFTGNRQLEIRDFPDPTPGPGEVVLEIKASGMCGSDLKFYRIAGGAASLGLKTGAGPVIAGHEPCGIVAAIGPG